MASPVSFPCRNKTKTKSGKDFFFSKEQDTNDYSAARAVILSIKSTHVQKPDLTAG
jgi:hypothetical protein